MTFPHTPVLLSEIIDAFKDLKIKRFIDGTLGAGGHAFALLDSHLEIEQYIGIDQDISALRIAKERLERFHPKLTFFQSNFLHIHHLLKKDIFKYADGILLDIGVSSMQLDLPERGFSFSKEGPLDMRMDVNQSLTAAKIVNEWPEEELGRIFRVYGEEKQWRIAAKTIVKARMDEPILTTKQLVNILHPLFKWRKTGINPLTLLFQALRIAVNQELDVLEKVLPQMIDYLSPGGRLAVISFHSLEDRIVKRNFRYEASDKQTTSGIGGVFLDKTPRVIEITKRPIIPTEEEIALNPRCRSAKLRIVEKI